MPVRQMKSQESGEFWPGRYDLPTNNVLNEPNAEISLLAHKLKETRVVSLS